MKIKRGKNRCKERGERYAREGGKMVVIVRTGFWIDSERILHQFTNDAPFSLVEPQVQDVFMALPSKYEREINGETRKKYYK